MNRSFAALSLLALLALAAPAVAAGVVVGPAPVVITHPDYSTGYTIPAATLGAACAVFINGDGYPVVRGADGRIVYVTVAPCAQYCTTFPTACAVVPMVAAPCAPTVVAPCVAAPVTSCYSVYAPATLPTVVVR